MTTYRRLWLTLAAVLGFVGCVLALLGLPAAAIVVVVVVVSAPAGAAAHQAAIPRTGDRRGTSQQSFLLAAVTTAAAAVAVVGLVAGLGAAGFLVVALAAATSPPAVTSLGRLLPTPGSAQQGPDLFAPPHRSLGSHGPAGAAPRWEAPDPGRLTDDELCLAWRASYLALQQAHRASDVVALVEARARYLDELERREPAGFARWIAGGARAASDPARYVVAEEQLPQRTRRRRDA